MRQRLHVVILILIGGVGLLLLAPALLRVREEANRSACANQLRRIAISSHNYHTDHERLPPGWIGPRPDRTGVAPAPHVGVLVYLLPYLTTETSFTWEAPYFQRELKARTDPPTDPDTSSPYTPPSDAYWWALTNPWTARSNRLLAAQRFPFLLCPSANASIPAEGWITALHTYSSDQKFHEDFLQRHVMTRAACPESDGWGATHYLGVAGRFGTGDEFAGIFTNRSRLTLGQITVADGTANTLLFGEAVGGTEGEPGPGERRLTAYSWFCGALPTYYGLPTRKHRPWTAFNGPHVARVNFVWGDGSVRSLKRFVLPDDWHEGGSLGIVGTDAWNMFQSLAGYRDGLVY